MGRRYQSGQILLVVVLIMVVALTVGLALAARMVTELRLSKQNEESQRAFQAAESGIQQTIIRQGSIGTLNSPIRFDNNSAFSTTYTAPNGSEILLNNGLLVDQSVGADVWLSKYSTDQSQLFLEPMGYDEATSTYNPVSITLYWGAPNQTSCSSGSGGNTAPAIEVSVLRGPKTNPTIMRNVFEVAGCNRIPNAKIGTAGTHTLSGGSTFRNMATLTFDAGTSLSHGLIMKVIPVYNSTFIGFRSPDMPFPAQGSVVASTGTSGDTVRKVTYFQSFPQLPLEVFPYSLLSQ